MDAAPLDSLEVGPHCLILGDCLHALAALPAESVDVVVTSPPYNLGIAYSKHDDRMAEAEYLAWMTQVAASVRRVMRPDGSFFLNIAGSSSRPWLPLELIGRLLMTIP